MSTINDNHRILINTEDIQDNTPVVSIETADGTIILPLMSFSSSSSEKPPVEVVSDPDYYLCIGVNGDTWTGVLLTKGSDNKYSTSGDPIEGLLVTVNTPKVGEMYTVDTGLKVDLPLSDSVVRVYSTGLNGNDQCGQGSHITADNIYSLGCIPGNIKFKQIASYMHSIGIDTEGTMWAVGAGSSGYLGTGSSSNATKFIRSNNKTWKYASVSAYVTAAIDTDDKLWVCGKNGGSNMGVSESTSYLTRSFVDTGLSNIVAMDVSNSHMIAVDSSGNLYVCGKNTYGELCTGDTTSRMLFENIGKPMYSGVELNIVDVKCGGSYTILLDENGHLYSCGLNKYGQLGNNTKTDSVALCRVMDSADATEHTRQYKAISVGNSHVLAIDTDDYLWVWGNAGNYRTFTGSSAANTTPVNPSSMRCKCISAGYDQSMAITLDGYLMVTGTSSYGQLGVGTGTTLVNRIKLNDDKWTNLGHTKRFTHFAWKA